MAQLLPVSVALAPGTLCEAREAVASLRSDIAGAQPLDLPGLSVPVRASGRIRLRFSQPLAEPLNLAFWAALTEQPFPREYTDTAPAGAREFVWPRGRYAITTLRRIKSSAAPGADQRLQLDFLQWTAQPAGEASHLVCGFYSDAAPGPVSVGYFAPLLMRGPVNARCSGRVAPGEDLIAAADGKVRSRLPADADADSVGVALDPAADGETVRIQLDVRPSP